ncbi:MAG TPA: hypothetical protein VJT78_02750 [Candidatus Dormibacteraeota bacterium]|nr:hypothetical protein [Candidatus Dormibacteraeota bacterium]
MRRCDASGTADVDLTDSSRDTVAEPDRSDFIPFSAPVFKCRLPITLFGAAARRGAFIDFHSGAVTPDPASAKVDVIPPPGQELIDKSYALYFDEAYARWLPVARNAVSPDGSHYAYTSLAGSTILHVVDVKTGVDQPRSVAPAGLRFAVIDYASDGIYIRDSGSIGADFVDPVKDEMHHADDPGDYEASAGNGLIWEGGSDAVGNGDPNPILAISTSELDKVNPTDGSRVVWFKRPGSSVRFLTQDPQGRPIVVLSTAGIDTEEFLYLPSAGVSREILRVGNGAPAISDPIADRHGVWFGAHDGIYLYTEKDGLRQVSRQGGIPANGCF